MLRALWNDEAGFVITSELLLIVTIMVIGLIVGMVAVRDAVVTELGDVAAAIGALNQTYRYNGVTNTCSGAWTAGSVFGDQVDECDLQTGSQGAAPSYILIGLSPSGVGGSGTGG
jgi:hypothetical protein